MAETDIPVATSGRGTSKMKPVSRLYAEPLSDLYEHENLDAARLACHSEVGFFTSSAHGRFTTGTMSIPLSGSLFDRLSFRSYPTFQRRPR